MSAAKKKAPTKKELDRAGVLLAAAIGPVDLVALDMKPDSTGEALFLSLVHRMKGLAEKAREDARRKAAARVPIVAPRYAKTLAQGIFATLSSHAAAKTMPAPWASLAQPVLHAAYMAASVPTLSTHDTHPGSRAGVVMVDFRKPEEFSTMAGELTFASVLARVTGEPRP